MRKTKTQKGITLIALIITIVVLMILAVVTINAVKDGGIITHAQDAATKYNTAKDTEEERLGEYENLLDEYANKDKIKYYIYDNYLIQKVDLIANTITTVNLSEYDVDNNKILSTETISADKIEEGISLSKGDVKITVDFAGKSVAIYIQGNKLYAPGEGKYMEYTQITDAEQIADIEEAIANNQ